MIAPQVWDADTWQVREGTAGSDPEVDIIAFVEEEIAPVPVVPEPPRKSPKDNWKKKKKKSVTRESEGRFVIWVKTPGSAQPAVSVEEERGPGSMARILTEETVHSAEDDAVLAAEAASVQQDATVRPVQCTDEVQPLTEDEEPIVETVDVPTLGASEAVAAIALEPDGTEHAEERMVIEINDSPVDGKQIDTLPVNQPSSPANTAATAMTAGGVQAKT
jgi:hypothetical protein